MFWVGGSLLKIIPSSGYVISTWGQRDDPPVLNNYYWLYFDRREVFFLGGWYIHNVSIFTERAFAAYSFMIGLIYELFFEKKKSKVRIIVLLTTIASTTSTTGAISAIIALFFFIRQSSAKSRYRGLSWVPIIPLLAVLVYYAVDYLLLSRASMGHSTESRTNDFLNGIAAWMESPIIGYGFANVKILAKMGTGYSNSITQVLDQGGIMLALLYVISFVKCYSRGIRYKNTNWIYFMLSFFVFFSTTGISTRNTILYLMIFMCIGCYQFNYVSIKSINLNKKRKINEGIT